MKLVAPFSNLSEVEMLIHCGADELYCGINTPEWAGRFGGRLWMNRRSPDSANLMSLKDLSLAIERAHDNGVPVYLTLNAPYYPEETVGYVLRLCEKLFQEQGVDGFIVADMNLLFHISEREFPARLHLSSLGSCFNRLSADFFHSLGVERIILPRQLRLSEIEELTSRATNAVEFEVFALNDGCYYEEGFCQTSHALGPFCMEQWKIEEVERGLSPLKKEELEANEKNAREYLWVQNNCGSSSRPDGLPEGPCALCWFAHFRDWNIDALKIVGREASFLRKMRSLQLAKAVLDKANEGADRESIRQFARSLRNTPELCDRGYMCYFRDE